MGVKSNLSASQPWLERLGYPVFLGLAAAVAFVTILYFFCPRFVMWKGLGLGTSMSYANPEVNRALATLQKIQNPSQFVEFPPGQNADINWRLLFPVLGYYLHIPVVLFFSLPHLGCLLTLALIIHLTWQRTRNRFLAVCAAILLGSTTWFFVSTGWLTYFDSWYVMGLLVVGFIPRRLALAASCLLAPWIDERFVITAPIAMIVRAMYFHSFLPSEWQKYKRDIVIFFMTLGFYIIMRSWITLYDPTPYTVASHLKVIASQFDSSEYDGLVGDSATFALRVAGVQIVNFIPLQMLESHWSGLRAAWFFVGCFFWLVLLRLKWLWVTVIVGLVLSLQIFLMVLGLDYSRNMSTFLPLALLGLLLLCKTKPHWGHKAVYLALAFNLLAPAIHGFNSWRIPIANLYTEIENYKTPPDYLNPRVYNKSAVKLMGRSDWQNALVNLNYALLLEPKYPDALYNRAMISLALDNKSEAIKDLVEAVGYVPANSALAKKAFQLLVEIEYPHANTSIATNPAGQQSTAPDDTPAVESPTVPSVDSRLNAVGR